MEIRLLCDDRDQLISERNRMINRLRWHLVTVAPDLEAQLPPRAQRLPDLRSPDPSTRSAAAIAQAAGRPNASQAHHPDRRDAYRPARQALPVDPVACRPSRRGTRTFEPGTRAAATAKNECGGALGEC